MTKNFSKNIFLLIDYAWHICNYSCALLEHYCIYCLISYHVVIIVPNTNILYVVSKLGFELSWFWDQRNLLYFSSDMVFGWHNPFYTTFTTKLYFIYISHHLYHDIFKNGLQVNLTSISTKLRSGVHFDIFAARANDTSHLKTELLINKQE